jgi:hypothetical protein
LLRKAKLRGPNGVAKRFVSYAVPMVRIHLPPAQSQVRTSPRFGIGDKGFPECPVIRQHGRLILD